MKFDAYIFFFENLVEKIQDSLKSDENDKHITWRPKSIFIISRWIILEWEMLQKNIVEKSKHFFFFEIGAVYKKIRAGQATDYNMAHAHCMMDT